MSIVVFGALHSLFFNVIHLLNFWRRLHSFSDCFEKSFFVRRVLKGLVCSIMSHSVLGQSIVLILSSQIVYTLLKYQHNYNIHSEQEACVPLSTARKAVLASCPGQLTQKSLLHRGEKLCFDQLWQITPSYSGLTPAKRSVRNDLLMLTFNNLSYHSGLCQASINYCLFEGTDLYSSIYMLVCFSTHVLRCFGEKFLVINVNFQCFWIGDYSPLGSLLSSLT